MISNLMGDPTSQIQGMDEETMSYMTGNGCQAGMNGFDPYYNYQMHASGYMQTPPQFMNSVIASTGPGAPLYFGPPHHRKGSFSSEDTDVDDNTTTNNNSNSNNMHQRENQHDSGNYGPPGANLFIFHLPNDLTNYGLYLLFRPYGRVLSVRIMINYTTGLSRGYGFVSLSKPEEAALAIKNMHGYNIGRKRLKVQLKMGEARAAAAHAAAAGMSRGRSISDSSAGANDKWVPPKKEKGYGSGSDDDRHDPFDGNRGDIDGTASGLTSAAASVAGD